MTTNPRISLLSVILSGCTARVIAAINMTYGQHQSLRTTPKLDPTGNQQDCLGMTPLHILACLSIHDLKLYRVIVEKYPANLITEDRWGYFHSFMHFGGMYLARLHNSCSRAINRWPYVHLGNNSGDNGEMWYDKRKYWESTCVKEMHFPEQPLLGIFAWHFTKIRGFWFFLVTI